MLLDFHNRSPVVVLYFACTHGPEDVVGVATGLRMEYACGVCGVFSNQMWVN